MSHEEAIQSLLEDGLDDWVSLHDVVWHGRENAGLFDGDVAAAVRAVVVRIIGEGLMVPGELGDPRIDAWVGTHDELVERVVRQAEEFDWNPQGAGCWFANTPEGDRRATESLAARTPPVPDEGGALGDHR